MNCQHFALNNPLFYEILRHKMLHVKFFLDNYIDTNSTTASEYSEKSLV